MKVLWVEDEPEVADRLIEEIDDPSIEFVVAGNVQAVLTELERRIVDLVICDLNIPESPIVPQAHTAHGLKVFDYIRTTYPGTPIIIYSGFGKLALAELGDRLSAAPQHDLYGDGPTEHVLHRSKSDPKRIVDDVSTVAARISALDQIEISPDTAHEYLTYYDRRLLRIYARQRQAVLIEVERLAGGRSSAVTVKLACESVDGPIGGAMVAKLNRHDATEDERKRYRDFLGGLGATTFTPLMETILAGAGDKAALFYSLAQGFDRSLFDLLAGSDSEAATVVRNLFEAMSAWREGANNRSVKCGEIRTSLLSDAHLAELSEDAKALQAKIQENQIVNVKWATSHGDLHGGNVLVRSDGVPVLIDYGRLGKMTACLDPITLELSAVLHPDSKLELEGWPTLEQAEAWNDLESYLEKCPIPNYVRACRNWTNSVLRAGRERDATVLSYSLRQLRFPDDIDPLLPAAYAKGAIGRLEAS